MLVDFNQVINQPANQLICCHHPVTQTVNNTLTTLLISCHTTYIVLRLVSSEVLNYESSKLACQPFLLETLN